jgi:hypothetical protein
LIRSTMALALFRTESDQRINCPIRTNTQRFCLARAVHYQPAPHHPGTRQEPKLYGYQVKPLHGYGAEFVNAAKGLRLFMSAIPRPCVRVTSSLCPQYLDPVSALPRVFVRVTHFKKICPRNLDATSAKLIHNSPILVKLIHNVHDTSTNVRDTSTNLLF